MLCPTCDKLKFRCVCPKPMSMPSSTPNELFDSTITTTSTTTTTTSSPSNNSFQTNLFRTSKSTDSIDTDCTTQTTVDTVDASMQRSSRLLSFQWSNVFNSRNSKSTSQLNFVNCDNNCNAESVPKIQTNQPHDQLTKGAINRNVFDYVFHSFCGRIQIILKF